MEEGREESITALSQGFWQGSHVLQNPVKSIVLIKNLGWHVGESQQVLEL